MCPQATLCGYLAACQALETTENIGNTISFMHNPARDANAFTADVPEAEVALRGRNSLLGRLGVPVDRFGVVLFL